MVLSVCCLSSDCEHAARLRTSSNRAHRPRNTRRLSAPSTSYATPSQASSTPRSVPTSRRHVAAASPMPCACSSRIVPVWKCTRRIRTMNGSSACCHWMRAMRARGLRHVLLIGMLMRMIRWELTLRCHDKSTTSNTCYAKATRVVSSMWSTVSERHSAFTTSHP